MAQLLANFDTAHCGIIHDAQLDHYNQCLATASADGHIRLWDVRNPKEPAFLSDLGSHTGAVCQVSWAPPEVGVLLASVGEDGNLIIWGRRLKPADWHVVHRECIEHHGAVRAVAWAPAEHGIILACASGDGSITVVAHMGRSGGVTVEHRWQRQILQAHRGHANAVSWAMPPVLSDGSLGALGFAGARFATAGDDGVRVWNRNEACSTWDQEAIEPQPNLDTTRDVAWKMWDGICDMLASANGQLVVIWVFQNASGDSGCWNATQRVTIGQEVWKLGWTDMGNMLLLSCGDKEQCTIFMKQQLSGEWDVMDIPITNT